MRKYEQQVRSLLESAADLIATYLPSYPCPSCKVRKTQLEFREKEPMKIYIVCYNCHRTTIFDQRIPPAFSSGKEQERKSERAER